MIKEFELSNIKHNVILSKELYLGDGSPCYGVFHEVNKYIYLAKNIKIDSIFNNEEDCVEDYTLCEIPDKLIEKTFYHELVHAILADMHEYDLSKNEQFVENFGNHLYEFMTTRK